MTFAPYQSMLDHMTPEQLQQVASGQGGDPIAQFAAVKALRDRTQMANAMNAAQQQPPQATVLENVVNQAKLAQIPKVGPNNTSPLIPQGIAAIAKAQGKGLQHGGAIEPDPVDNVNWIRGLVREQDVTLAPSERRTPGEREIGGTGLPPYQVTPQVLDLVLEATGQRRPQQPEIPYADTSGPGRMGGMNRPRGDIAFDGEIAQPEQSAEEMLRGIFGDTPSVGGGGRLNPADYGIDLSGGRPELADSVEEVAGLYPSGEKSRARRTERLQTLEKEAMQENAFQRNMGIAMMGLGIAGRGWSGAREGLEMISNANTANRQTRERLAAMGDRIEESAIQEAQNSFNQATNMFQAASADYRQAQQLQIGIDQFNANMGLREAEMQERLTRPERELQTMAAMLYAASQGTDEPLTEQEALRQAITLGVTGASGRGSVPDDASELVRVETQIAELIGSGQAGTPEGRRVLNSLIGTRDALAARGRTNGLNVLPWEQSSSGSGASSSPPTTAYGNANRGGSNQSRQSMVGQRDQNGNLIAPLGR